MWSLTFDIIVALWPNQILRVSSVTLIIKCQQEKNTDLSIIICCFNIIAAKTQESLTIKRTVSSSQLHWLTCEVNHWHDMRPTVEEIINSDVTGCHPRQQLNHSSPLISKHHAIEPRVKTEIESNFYEFLSSILGQSACFCHSALLLRRCWAEPDQKERPVHAGNW